MPANKPSPKFRHGKGYSVQIGQRNKNHQVCLGTQGKKGTDQRGKQAALAYAMFCLHCGKLYGANEGGVWQRKCPKCQGGATGIDF